MSIMSARASSKKPLLAHDPREENDDATKQYDPIKGY